MKFVGSYPQTVKTLLAASAISGHNVMLLSAPGWGKTEMALAAGRAICGPSDGLIKIELDPSTPPEAVRGAYDPVAMLNGKVERITTGTAYDPNAHVVLLDEAWRANDVVFDALIHATSRKDLPADVRPVFWGTSNFVGKGERTEALRDRFALWVWLEPDLNVKSISDAHLFNGTGIDPDWTRDLPTWEECVAIRQAVPTERAARAVSTLIENLVAEAEAANFVINPRRIVQWAEILFRNSVRATGTADFAAIPPQVAALLRYAYPLVTREDARKWAQVVSSISDPLGSAIEAYRAEAITKFKAVTALKSQSERSIKATELGVVLANAQTDLIRIGGDDPRVAQTIAEMTGWLTNAILGKDLE